MSKYLSWNTKKIDDFSNQTINNLYNEGYVFTRIGRGVMNQTRSVRIDLDEFELSSENRRILKKTGDWRLEIGDLPYEDYAWQIGKMAKDFYDEKFGKGIFSANKVKELMTTNKGNFNTLFAYVIPSPVPNEVRDLGEESRRSTAITNSNTIGYCIALETNKIIHYSYPFYQLQISNHRLPNVGMGMMLKAILYAKENNKKYIYLGSAQRPGDKYKLQFKGLEWFDGDKWSDDLGGLKKNLKE
ncbi:MAG: hypothetical protein GF349_02310 [Candidatus Magasanikbacteria bacterium]|nr:hypothetical protein [Candidatus Magasanikbacteria bacterium]